MGGLRVALFVGNRDGNRWDEQGSLMGGSGMGLRFVALACHSPRFLQPLWRRNASAPTHEQKQKQKQKQIPRLPSLALRLRSE